MEMRVRRSPRASNRGAVLAHVAVVLIVLIGFSALAVDFGVLWVSRNQAQNAADAGALAGAVSLAFDGDDRTASGPAVTNAVATANQNLVFGQSAGVTPAQVTFPPRCPDGTDTCVRVDVYRNGESGSQALPVFFARMFRVTSQGVKATATAQAAFANAARCLKPWAIADKWRENYPTPGPWTLASSFDLYYPSGPLRGLPIGPPSAPDVYNGTEFLSLDPLQRNPSYTGFLETPISEGGDLGLQVTLKVGSPTEAPTPGWFLPLAVPWPDSGATGAALYRRNIGSCNPALQTIGSDYTVEPGNMIGPTRQGVLDLVATAPAARWDSSLQRVVDCPAPCQRIAPMAVFDPYVYELNRHSGRVVIHTTKVLGFFVEGMSGNDVVGRYVGTLGLLSGNATGGETPWLRTIRLVR